MLGPIDAIDLMKRVLYETKWVTNKYPKSHFPSQPFLVHESGPLSLLSVQLKDTVVLLFGPYLKNFGFHWNFAYCIDGLYSNSEKHNRSIKQFELAKGETSKVVYEEESKTLSRTVDNENLN